MPPYTSLPRSVVRRSEFVLPASAFGGSPGFSRAASQFDIRARLQFGVLSRALRAPSWLRFGQSVLLAVAAFGLTMLMRLHERTFLLPMIAVLVAALQGGFGPGHHRRRVC